MIRRICILILTLSLLMGYMAGLAQTILEKDAPAPTEAPPPTQEPFATEAPAPTQEPLTTQAPVPTEEPLATQAPVPTEEPLATEAPVPTEEPFATEAPVPTEEPFATEAPAPTEEPLATEASVPTEDPLATEAPVPTEEPLATQAPAPAQEQALLAMPVAESTAAPASQGTILALLNGDALDDMEPVTISVGDPDPLHLRMLELRNLQASALSPDGAQETITLQVSWDLTRLSTDIATPGRYSESAPILAPDGYAFAEGVPAQVTIPVIVAEPEGPDVIVSFDDIACSYAYAIDQGSDWDAFFSQEFSDDRWYFAWPCRTDAGETIWAHVSWQNPHPDTSQTGRVVVSGSAVLPESSVLAEGVSLPTVQVSVSVQSTKSPALHSWYMSYGNINIPWVGGGLEEDESPRLLISADGGEWTPTVDVEYDGSALVVYLSCLEQGHAYQIKAVWDGGETGAFQFNWDGELTDVRYYEGDRDGGDVEGNGSQIVVQPAPSQDSHRESASGEGEDVAPAFIEESGETYSLISGLRLMLMRESGPVRFSKQGITATLSNAALDALNIREDSRFRIHLQKTEDGFILTAELDGEAVEYLPDTRVFLPGAFERGDALPVLWNARRAYLCRGSYDSAAGVTGFTVHAAGDYSVMDVSRFEMGIGQFLERIDARALGLAAWCAQLLMGECAL